MNTRSLWATVRLWLALLALLALSIAGFWGVDQEWNHADSPGAKLSVFMQTLYSVLGLVAMLLVWRRSRWARALLYFWALALLFTGATAPVIWAGAGWGPALFAASLCAVCAGFVIWLAPLPPAAGPLRKGRWLVAALAAAGALMLIATLLQMAPAVMHGKAMESFCAGMREHVTLPELKAKAEQQGYVATLGQDEQGPFLKITGGDPDEKLQYDCTARFKPDGSIESLSFKAGATAN